MGVPQGPYGPQGPYQPQNQGGYQQGPPPGQGGYGGQQGPPPGQGYQAGPPPQGGYPGMGGGTGGYDFGAMYGQADMSAGVRMEEDRYPAVVEESTWDLTKDGTKGAWTIVFRTTAPGLKKGQGSPGSKMTMTMSVNPTKNNGDPNPAGLGIMYRQLGALGIPIPPAIPFWQLGWTPQQVAHAMTGKPCIIVVRDDEYDGVTRSKVRDIQPPAPGQPAQVPQAAQAPQQAPQGYAPQGGGQQAPQPWQQPQQPPGDQQGYAQGQQWQQQGGYNASAPQGGQPGQGYNPALPPYAQQAQPGQGGIGQFTPEGQALQPGIHPGHAEQIQQQGYQQQGPPNGQPQQGQPQGGSAPAPPPWAAPPQ